MGNGEDSNSPFFIDIYKNSVTFLLMNIADAKIAALRIAKECGEKVYIADCKIYVDEFDEGPYIVGSLAAFATMYDRLKQYGGKVVGVVDPDGTCFLNFLELDA